MDNIRLDTTAKPGRKERSYKGEVAIYYNFVPLAKDSTWDELESYIVTLRDDCMCDGNKIQEVYQALLDRYNRGERTKNLKEEMRTAW